MGNECENWFEVKSTNKADIEKIKEEIMTIGWNGCYGFRDIDAADNSLTSRATTKWNPPLDMFSRWLSYPDLHITVYYKEEFLQFAGRIVDESQEHVDFALVTSDDVRSAREGLLFELNEKLSLADHMDDEQRNDN